MSSFEELRESRLAKLKKLKEKGIDPYPVSSLRQYTLKELHDNFEKLSKKKEVIIAGRVMALRSQGGLIFSDLNDGTQTFQTLVKKDEAGEELFNLFNEVVDIGDFVESRGSLFVSKRGEKTLLVKNWRMLSKTVRPLPDQWSGLSDTEERFRKRYLDLLINKDIKKRFEIRSQLVTLIRRFFDEAGYIEVETPRLQSIAGGATAKPFVTHHNALDVDFYLTIAQELYLKELLVGGFNKVYEIGRKFRNEGIDVTHNPEFTMLESQEAYSDANGQMDFIEKLMKWLVKEIFSGTELEYDGNKVNFESDFPRIPFYELIRRYALIPNPESIKSEELKLKAKQLGITFAPNEADEKIMDSIYKKVVRPKLIQPTFIVDYPVEFNPFAKRKENDKTLIDRFQLVVGSLEIVNAFSELNDPVDQKLRYEEQDKKKRDGEGEISPSDEAYLEAMEYGMPPNGGIGIGIDRLAMLFTNQKNIREVILFPTLRPEGGKKEEDKQ